MKKLNFLFVALFLVFTSCSKDDDSSSDTSGDILGKWDMTSYDYVGKTVTSTQGQTLTTDFVGEAFDIDYNIAFEENPNEITSEGSFSLKLTSTVLGQATTQNISNFDVGITSGTWEKNGNEIITKSIRGEANMKIEELTNTSLVLSIEEELDLSQSGFPGTSNIKAVLSFKRN